MDNFVNDFASLGLIGIIGWLLFSTFLQERKTANEETRNTITYLKQEISTSRELYKSELEKDREVYVESISKITNSISEITSRIDNIEEDVKDIKDKLDQ